MNKELLFLKARPGVTQTNARHEFDGMAISRTLFLKRNSLNPLLTEKPLDQLIQAPQLSTTQGYLLDNSLPSP